MKEILVIKNEELTVNLGQDFVGVHTYDEKAERDKLIRVSFENFDCFSTTLNDWKRLKVAEEIRFLEVPGVGVKVILLIEGEVRFAEVYVLRKVDIKETSLIVDGEGTLLASGFMEVSKI